MCHYTIWGPRKSKQFAGHGYHGVCSGPAASRWRNISARFLPLPPIFLCQHHPGRKETHGVALGTSDRDSPQVGRDSGEEQNRAMDPHNKP